MKNYVLYYTKVFLERRTNMKHVKTLNTRKLQNTEKVDVANVRHPASLHARLPVL